MATDCKYLIIGAGVSGLTFANFINHDDYLILEKEAEPGGYCRTIYQDGYIWDYAGHFFHFATDKVKEIFKNRISSEELIYKDKCTKIFYKDKIIDFPFQTNIHQLEKEEFIVDCTNNSDEERQEVYKWLVETRNYNRQYYLGNTCPVIICRLHSGDSNYNFLEDAISKKGKALKKREKTI